MIAGLGFVFGCDVLSRAQTCQFKWVKAVKTAAIFLYLASTWLKPGVNESPDKRC